MIRGCSAVSLGLLFVSSAGAAPLKGAPSASGTLGALDAPSTYMRTLERDTPRGMRDLYEQRGISHSVAREWNEVVLHAIRNDFARPTVHARNLYHTSAAMWDAWSAYDTSGSEQVLHNEKLTSMDVQADREKAISFAVYRILRHRFAASPGAAFTYAAADALMLDLGYDTTISTTMGDSPEALGNRIAAAYILYGLDDGANEGGGYANQIYFPFNPSLIMDLPGNPGLFFEDRWQPLSLDFFIDQSGNPVAGGSLEFLSPEWGEVKPFALEDQDLTVKNRTFTDWNVWVDPGPPPTFSAERERYTWGFEMVMTWSSHLDPADKVMWDISPASIGNADLASVDQEQAYYDYFDGGDWGQGWDTNPVTGQPYEIQEVPRGDYGRILAEFWADGPDSETPPGHWFTILNVVNDHPLHENRYMGQGPLLDDLEWDVKAYLSMGGMMHDVAISAWSVKGFYDYIRPVSVLRWLAGNGQSSDPALPSYSEQGMTLIPGFIELVTPETTAPNGIHEHLAGSEGKVAVKAWRGPEFIDDDATDVAGVGWILGENWWPYQRPSFVTPPFAGYVSGHSTYSRGAAELMTLLTGDEFFPGGLGEFEAPMNEFLVFEDGPSVDVVLQWATYRDASDQCSLSRIWGGIHPPADDLPGREMGEYIGPKSFTHARRFFEGLASCPIDFARDGKLDMGDISVFISMFKSQDLLADLNGDTKIDFADVSEFLTIYAQGCP